MGWPCVWNLDSGSNAALHPQTVPQMGFQPGDGGGPSGRSSSLMVTCRGTGDISCAVCRARTPPCRGMCLQPTLRRTFTNKFYSLPSIARLAEKWFAHICIAVLGLAGCLLCLFMNEKINEWLNSTTYLLLKIKANTECFFSARHCVKGFLESDFMYSSRHPWIRMYYYFIH